ncbi:hypothetical protein H4219_005991 [Mycoemilia scoparia]|uniref:DUF7492 domain-containing protein n=1 Tax=Mycoemilia scoparia TaxID=417184 RepID=A0A9W7ZTL3_9FUNG|nr:hypothetical protein H4219_005991 [Mycoemilia scoparia]
MKTGFTNLFGLNGSGFVVTLATTIAVVSSIIPSVLAHSWVDCAKYDPDSTLCFGYGRGYTGRGNRDINTLYTYLFDGTPQHQPMCNPIQQTSQNYTDLFPMALAYPGETIYQAWEANGHMNNAKPTKIDVLYYDDPSKQFMDYSERKTAMKAGTMNFATNQNCRSPSDPNSVCTGSFVVPPHLKPGNVYHFVWFWYFDENPAGQQYSTCFELKVVDKSEVDSARFSGSTNLVDKSTNMNGQAQYKGKDNGGGYQSAPPSSPSQPEGQSPGSPTASTPPAYSPTPETGGGASPAAGGGGENRRKCKRVVKRCKKPSPPQYK